MSDFQCKFYLLDSSETLMYSNDDFRSFTKIADRPFPDSLLSSVYYDINSWEPRFHEADRALMEFYQSRDTKCLKLVQKLLHRLQAFRITRLIKLHQCAVGFMETSFPLIHVIIHE